MPDNGIAVEPREAQRPTSLAARTPTAAILGNGDIAVGAIKTDLVRSVGGLASPWRLPALHPPRSRGEGKWDASSPRARNTKNRGIGALAKWSYAAFLPHKRSLAIAAPSPSAFSFAQTMLSTTIGSVRTAVPKPQSTPAITRSRPTMSA